MVRITRDGLEKLLTNLPIDRNMIEGRVKSYNVLKLEYGKGFVKRFSDIQVRLASDYGNYQDKINSAEGNWKYVEIAKFFKKVTEEGFYHPKTRFIVCEDRKGNPTIMAIMPELKPLDTIEHSYDKIIEDNKTIKDKKENLKKKFGLKELSGDTNCEFNYGLSPEGEVYYFDLDLLARK